MSVRYTCRKRIEKLTRLQNKLKSIKTRNESHDAEKH